MKNFKTLFIAAIMFAHYASFAQTWSAVGDGIGDAPNDRANALVEYKDNMYAGGMFTLIQGTVSLNVYLSKWDGSTWSSAGLMMNDRVNSMAVYKDTLYIAGDFTQLGLGITVPANHIAKWDGSTLTPVPSNTAMTGPVHALCVYNNELYAAGSESGGNASILCKWNGSVWATVITLDNRVQTMLVYNNALYVGGQFTTVGSLSASKIAKYDGTNWGALGSGMNNNVYALAEYKGNLYVGGSFSSANGNNISRWDGNTWSAVGSGLGDWCLSLASYHGRLYAGGTFITSGTTACNYIASWDGTSWKGLGLGLGNNCFALGVYNDSLLYASGTFSMAAGAIETKHIARWHEPALVTSTVGIAKNTPPQNNFVVFPNPANDEIYISQKNRQGSYSVKVLDVLGKEIIHDQSFITPHSKIDVSNLASGIYFISISDNLAVTQFKIIKQ